MQKAYIVHLFTGACVEGVYSTLQAAKDAVGAHFAVMGCTYNPALWEDSFGNGMLHTYPDAAPDNEEGGAIESVYIVQHTVDAALEPA